MKKRMTIALTGALAAMTAVTFTSCGDGGLFGGDDNVPDPAGTITANISESSNHRSELTWTGEYCPTESDLYVRWAKPDNISVSSLTVGSSKYNGVIYYYDPTLEMADVGAVAGLGNVRKVPDAGWGNNFACEQGHGYIIRIKSKSERKGINWFEGQPITASDPDYWEETQYARMYVVEPIVSTDGGVMGAKVKIQYPFEP